MKNLLLEALAYESYKYQREDWFDPKTCDSTILSGIKHLYPEWERYEEEYLKEKKNELK